jgi:hypothetical protein
MHSDGVLRGNNVIKYVPGESLWQLEVGEPIRLREDDFERLSEAFFDELERKFL